MSNNGYYFELISIFASKLENQQMVDFYFEFTDNTRFGVHSLILGTQSAIFKEMMKKSSKTMKIHEISSGTFKKLVQVVYCADISMESLEEGKELYEAGKKYGIEEAVNIARSAITKFCRDQKDALEVYDMAKIHKDIVIKDHCMKCFSDGIRKYLGLEENEAGNPFIFELQNVSSELQTLLQEILNSIKEQTNLDAFISSALGFLKVLHVAANRILRETFLLSDNGEKFQIDNDSYGQTFDLSSSFMRSVDLPPLTNTPLMKNEVFAQFRFIKAKEGEKVWVIVHQHVLENYSIPLFLMASKETDIQIQNVQFETFYLMIKSMYNVEIDFADQHEAFEFYSACKKFEYSRGIKIAIKYLVQNTEDKHEIQELYKFAKSNQDLILQDHCLKFFEYRVENSINEIFSVSNVLWSTVSFTNLTISEVAEEIVANSLQIIEDTKNLDQKLMIALNYFDLFRKMMLITARAIFSSDNEVNLNFGKPEETQEEMEEQEDEEDYYGRFRGRYGCDCDLCTGRYEEETEEEENEGSQDEEEESENDN